MTSKQRKHSDIRDTILQDVKYYCILGRIHNEQIRDKLEVNSILDRVMRWKEHVERILAGNIPKATMTNKPARNKTQESTRKYEYEKQGCLTPECGEEKKKL